MASLEAQEAGAAKENQVDVRAQDPAAGALPHQKSWLVRHFSLLLRRDRQAQKAGQLFSGLLALNVVFLGGAFVCSMIFNNVAVTLGDVWILLAVLRALSLLWLLYYRTGTSRRPHAVLYRDPHAGPIWVRGECGGWAGAGWWEGRAVRQVPMAAGPPGSLLLFGGFTICLNGFRVGYDLSHSHCKSQLELIFPAVEIIFVGIQVTGLPLRQATRTHAPACAWKRPDTQTPAWLRVCTHATAPHKGLSLCAHVHTHLRVPAPAHTVSLKCRRL